MQQQCTGYVFHRTLVLYLNDLPNLPFSSSSNLTLYADDILLSNVISSPFCMSSVQSNINLISSWLSSRHLYVNTSKTKYMIVTRKSSSFINALPPLLLNDVCLQCVSSFKYLGVILCSNLSWSPHIKFVCSKSRKVLGVIFRHFYRFSSPKSLLCLYKSLVIPHLSYCSSVWSPPPSSQVMLAPSKMFNSSLSNSVLKTGLPAIPLYSHLLVSPPSLLVAIILN